MTICTCDDGAGGARPVLDLLLARGVHALVVAGRVDGFAWPAFSLSATRADDDDDDDDCLDVPGAGPPRMLAPRAPPGLVELEEEEEEEEEEDWDPAAA